MMKKVLVLCLLLGSVSLKAQTVFNQWEVFKTDRFGFSMNYPDSWVMIEKGNAEYVFKSEVGNRGTFKLKVEEKTDSSAAVAVLKQEEDLNAGSRFSVLNDRCILMYKTMAIVNGSQFETHHWTISAGNKVLYCSFTYDAKKRNDANLKEEILLAYQMIESLSFYEI